MKEYIDFNTLNRQNASNPFEKDSFKLMNNSVFGKTIENTRKRVDVKLVNDEKKRTKLTSQPHFKRMTIFTEDMAGIEMKKKAIRLMKPIYCGMAILDNSKMLMYRFHYEFIKQRYGSDATLLFTDTDSLCYHIKTEDVYQDMFERKEEFDFSDYPKDSQFHDPTNSRTRRWLVKWRMRPPLYQSSSSWDCVRKCTPLRPRNTNARRLKALIKMWCSEDALMRTTKQRLRNRQDHSHGWERSARPTTE